MADMTIKIKKDASDEAKAEMASKVRKGLLAAGIQASSAAREELQKSPQRIDTGLLRNSITYAMDGESPAISNYKADKASKYTG